MLFRLFKVNNGALEVLEESTVQERRKLIHRTKFSCDGKDGEFSRVINSLQEEWSLHMEIYTAAVAETMIFLSRKRI